MLTALLVEALRLFKVFRAFLLPAACRFAPSCSEYAIEALTRHGALRGSGMTASRLLRCHPWHPGGLDPVP